MRYFATTFSQAATIAAHGARSLRDLSLEERAYSTRDVPPSMNKQGRHTELDDKIYRNAAEIVKNSPKPLIVRVLMKQVGYKSNAEGREKFLRSLMPHDVDLFTSDDDDYIGYLGLHDEQILAYEALSREEKQYMRNKRRKPRKNKEGV